MPEKLEVVSENDTKTVTREELCEISAEAVAHFFDDAPEGLSPETIAMLKMTLIMFSGAFIGKLLDKE